MKSLILSTAVLSLLTGLAPLQAASIFTETFSNSGSTEGWFEVADVLDTTLEQDSASSVLKFSGNATSLFYVAADALSSGGAFSGDYSAAGISGIAFSLSIQPGSSMTDLVFELTNLSEGETWQYALTLDATGAEQSYTVPLSDDGAGWTQVSGDESFAFLLGNVEEAGIALSGSAAGNVSGYLDNVSTVPEVSAPVLAMLSALALAGRRRNVGH